MNITWAKWQSLTDAEREAQRSTGALTPELIGLEGWRVAVVYEDGGIDRFIVSRSCGWLPVHVRLRKRTSRGGIPVPSNKIIHVHKLYKVREGR